MSRSFNNIPNTTTTSVDNYRHNSSSSSSSYTKKGHGHGGYDQSYRHDDDHDHEIEETEFDAPPLKSFEDLPDVSEDLIRGIYAMGFETPSPIQSRALIPLINGKDTLAQGHSGTGKTALFSIGIVHNILRGLIPFGTPENYMTENDMIGVQYIIISPTVTLSIQTYKTLKTLTTFLKDDRTGEPLIDIVLSVARRNMCPDGDAGAAMNNNNNGGSMPLGENLTYEEWKARKENESLQAAAAEKDEENIRIPSFQETVSTISKARRPQILVTSVGRLETLLCHHRDGSNNNNRRGRGSRGPLLINPCGIKGIVLDEADELLKNNFKDKIMDIDTGLLTRTNSYVQTILISATMPAEVKALANKILRKNNRAVILIDKNHQTLDGIEEFIIDMGELERETPEYFKFDPSDTSINATGKVDVLLDILKYSDDLCQCIIFCKDKKNVRDLHEELTKNKYTVGFIHGDITRQEQQRILTEFNNGQSKILISTDILCRGYDCYGISHVFNFDFPTDPENYIHRIGRSGRYGRKGKSISFITKNEHQYLSAVETRYKKTIPKFPF